MASEQVRYLEVESSDAEDVAPLMGEEAQPEAPPPRKTPDCFVRRSLIILVAVAAVAGILFLWQRGQGLATIDKEAIISEPSVPLGGVFDYPGGAFKFVNAGSRQGRTCASQYTGSHRPLYRHEEVDDWATNSRFPNEWWCEQRCAQFYQTRNGVYGECMGYFFLIGSPNKCYRWIRSETWGGGNGHQTVVSSTQDMGGQGFRSWCKKKVPVAAPAPAPAPAGPASYTYIGKGQCSATQISMITTGNLKPKCNNNARCKGYAKTRGTRTGYLYSTKPTSALGPSYSATKCYAKN